MKKLLALMVLTIFTFGFGVVALAAESARSNSPLSKVEPAMVKEEAPVATTKDMVSQKAAVPTDENAIALEEAANDLSVPAEENEAVPTSSDTE